MPSHLVEFKVPLQLGKFHKISWWNKDETRATGIHNFWPKLAQKYLRPNMKLLEILTYPQQFDSRNLQNFKTKPLEQILTNTAAEPWRQFGIETPCFSIYKLFSKTGQQHSDASRKSSSESILRIYRIWNNA